MSSLPSVDVESPRKTKKRTTQNGKAQQDATPTQRQLPEPAPVTEGYIPRNVDVRMNRQQATILRDKVRILQDSGARTADGRHVTNRAQAVRWILENEVVL